MNKPRYMNLYKALKKELDYYKYQNLNFHFENKPFHHLRLKSFFSRYEVMDIPKDRIPEILIRRISRAFEDSIMQFPIIINYKKESGIYEAVLDLYIEQKNGGVKNETNY